MRNIKYIVITAVAGLIAIAVGYGQKLPNTPPKCP